MEPGHGHVLAGAGDGAGWVVTVLVVVVPVAAYVLAAVRRRVRRSTPWPAARTASWVAGATLVGVAVSPPLTALAHADPRGHMAQHLLVGMYAPVALVLAAPVTLTLAASAPATGRRLSAVLRRPVVHTLTHPVTAAVLSVGGLAVLYLTPLYATTLRSDVVHAAVTVHLLVSGTLFAWAVAGPDPAPRRPRTATRLTVLVLAAGAHAALAKTLFAHAGTLPPGAGQPRAATEAAAQWMYYGGDLAEVALAVALLGAWYRRTRPRGSRATRLRGAVAPVRT
ncbi:cytochrome c oxidase assembly protein [Cellulomonas fimi]|uniref:cytochrome c oxidase assembly protein n=1 Tax=Cellulomonas fimi TaxID=1708 RepID=UPI00234C6A00|nr:cytochrome c oxidase assembly protein [Cellulomonas fimi]MDC7121613.1 cytochrome c oxidase assembly protein [Cellulomonas fimi]